MAAMKLYAVTPPGLEAVVGAELAALGITGAVAAGGVEWEGDVAGLRLANLHLRCATRVLLRLAEFHARTFFELERHAARVPWEQVVANGGTVALRVTAKKSKLYHEGAIAERLQAAIVRRTNASFVVSGVDEEEGAADLQLLIVRVSRDQFTISADSSGEALHRRGYRQAIGQAPLRESLAAALIQLVGWRGDTPLFDPFCGSGPIPIEAALLARRIAPGISTATRAPRHFAFTTWPQHDARAWQEQVAAAQDLVRPHSPVAIRGSDRAARVLASARANAERAGVAGDVEWLDAPFTQLDPPSPDAALVSNPPYGVRLAPDRDRRDLWAALGRFVRERLPAGRVGLLCPDAALERQLALPLHAAAVTRNGGIPVRMLVGPAPPAE